MGKEWHGRPHNGNCALLEVAYEWEANMRDGVNCMFWRRATAETKQAAALMDGRAVCLTVCHF